MQISSLVTPAAIRVVGHLTSKKRLFQDLAEAVAALHGVDPGHAVEALQERESLGPTGVGHGIALPHARVNGLSRVCGVFFRLERPLEFGAVDRQPVDLIFALFAPREAGVEHLKALALVSRTMRDAGRCAKLRANTDPVTLHAILTEGETSKAA
ncbi:PTS sugar transporter subunit IIA [Rhodobaculum claviforme]|uniref:PTS lactose transporter subunit IIC n=1 Tax=Rhodobaculum claviforme TaxID=1549854 RepID=A0A934TNF0_9RHOB|nr:PTS sugar transporter subunit IIA [Rhodobaculum claviforme]MBK5928781.1 PTS lactose transporter subunit IIC [Rhodobaculum claviforme]